MRNHYDDIPAYVTKDGSTIRELMHPARHGGQNQSLAEAIVAPGAETRLHRHRITEEIYHITAGTGRMTLDGEVFDVAPGDTILIPPGAAHCIRNTGEGELKILCCCAPAYSHDDTAILDNP